MKTILIYKRSGTFAENKDIARKIRLREVIPSLEKKKEVTLDFNGVEMATQGFIHVLIGDVLTRYGSDALGRVTFKSCNETVKKIITIVIDYMQEGMGIETE